MRVRAALLTAAMLGLTPSGAIAQTLQISWDACDPVVTHRPAVEGTTVDFYASAIDHSAPVLGYQVAWVVGDASNRIPDAWRFDTQGCQALRYSFLPQPPQGLSGSCPPIFPIEAQPLTVSIYQFAPSPLLYPTTMGHGELAVADFDGSGVLDPATRYHGARFQLDFSLAKFGPTGPGTCGGLETRVTIQLIPARCRWIRTDQMEFRYILGNSELTYGGDAVPANASTWGQIKSQYRR